MGKYKPEHTQDIVSNTDHCAEYHRQEKQYQFLVQGKEGIRHIHRKSLPSHERGPFLSLSP